MLPNLKKTNVDVLVIGAGQAGLALSAHLRRHDVPHLLVDRSDHTVDRWRSERWDSLVSNGPSGHDCFPGIAFPPDVGGPEVFASRDQIVAYFEEFAKTIEAPVRCGVNVVSLMKSNSRGIGGGGEGGEAFFRAETAQGEIITTRQVVVATGSFQLPMIPPELANPPPTSTTPPNLVQIHSSAYKNPAQLPPGAVLVVGAGSSGAQIADELLRAGRHVYLAVGRHSRPPRRYRGKDNTWWLDKLGKWDVRPNAAGGDAASKHVPISVTGVNGGSTIDFREFASRGMVLLGRAERWVEEEEGEEAGDGGDGKSKKKGTTNRMIMRFAPNVRENVETGDRDYLSVLREADEFVAREGLDLPEDPDAHRLLPDPPCLTHPQLELDLEESGVSSIIWATGYARDFGWVKIDGALDEQGRPVHKDGVSSVPGLYYVGLPWLRSRASSFIWGVWNDAEYVAQRVSQDTA